jgi:transcriptional regulator with XRE-family HTH domain
MPVSSSLRALIARANRERAAEGRPALSLRRLAEESGVSLSVLVALHTGRSRRVDYATLDRLLSYFARSIPVTMNDLLVWDAEAASAPVAAGA